jgi:hypothetical protein
MQLLRGYLHLIVCADTDNGKVHLCNRCNHFSQSVQSPSQIGVINIKKNKLALLS